MSITPKNAIFTSDKTTRLLVQLNKETTQKTIRWEVIDTPPALNQGSEDLIPLVYTCIYKGKRLALFKKKYKYFYDEHDFYWGDALVFAILSESGNIIWENKEHSQALNDLFDVVSQQAAGVDDLLDGFF